ncbi:MAG TPA: hypothetical protein VK559_11575 [Ferruginibacter sp.]|nr:hypothetical protein [Ferruginibacter sp.]
MKPTFSNTINYDHLHHLDDSILIVTNGGICKNKGIIVTESDPTPVQSTTAPAKQQAPLLTLHGNVLYNFNYRSYIDTPFAQSGLIQHTLQSYINGNIAGQYPFRAIFTYRNSNSPYFSNSSDVSVQYRQPDMFEQIKSDLRKDADSSFDKNLLVNPALRYTNPLNDSLLALAENNPLTKSLYKKYDSLYTIYKQNRQKLEALEAMESNRNPMQALIEAREAKLAPKAPATDSLTDSLNIPDLKNMWGASKSGEFLQSLPGDTALITKLISRSNADSDQAKIKQRQDSIMKLRIEVMSDENKILSLQKKLTDSLSSVKQKINQLNDPEAITNYIDQNDTTEKKRLTGVQKFLLSVDQIGIGRSWLNYSELTVKNVSLNGFNIEMNPHKLYVAGAIGSVNSQFRNFVLNNNTSTDQSVKLVRFGIKTKSRNSLIFTVYGGHKALLSTVGIDSSQATQKIMGASLAATVPINKNITVTAEYARSSYSEIYDPTEVNKGLFSKVVNFGMRANEAWNIKFQSIYPRTNTKIDGSYSKMGAAFQSFTIYTSNVKQDAYLLHVNQLFLKKKLSLDASISKNDFNSPLTAPGYSNSAVFKSIQLSLAIPRYPFVSIGYYPTSQLFSGGGNVVYQSWYNTLNAISSYSYKLAKLNMSTNVVYTKFYTNQTDTAIVYDNASTFTINHSVYLTPFIFQGNLTVTDQLNIHLVTVEPLVSYNYKNILTLSASVKWSKLNGTQDLWGGTAGMGILIKNIGTIQFNYDKVYLPAYSGALMPVDMGRITFNKIF